MKDEKDTPAMKESEAKAKGYKSAAAMQASKDSADKANKSLKKYYTKTAMKNNKLYALAEKKASSKKAQRKFAADPENAKVERRYDFKGETEKRFRKLYGKKGSVNNIFLGDEGASSYLKKREMAKKNTESMRKKMS